MGEDLKVGCARPTGGPVGENVETKEQENQIKIKENVMIKVGQKNGLFYVFIPVILRLFEQQRFRQLPENSLIFRILV